MSYLPGTILKRKEPVGDALDDLRVVAPSPMRDASVDAWQGSGGDAVIVTPNAVFGGNEILPLDVGAAEYDVVSVPETNIQSNNLPPEPDRNAPQLTPEQQFAAHARAAKPKAKKAEASGA